MHTSDDDSYLFTPSLVVGFRLLSKLLQLEVFECFFPSLQCNRVNKTTKAEVVLDHKERNQLALSLTFGKTEALAVPLE